MRDAGKERDRDFITLNTVLQCNQDVINVSQTNSALIQWYTHTVYLITWLVTAAIIHECYSLESKWGIDASYTENRVLKVQWVLVSQIFSLELYLRQKPINVLYLQIAPACRACREGSSPTGDDERMGSVERERFSSDYTGEGKQRLYFPAKGGAGEFMPRCAGRHGVIFLSLSDLSSLAKCSWF